MLNNKQIVERIRKFGQMAGLNNDTAVLDKCDFDNRAQLNNMLKIKTAPQLDTLNKFARGLGVQIEDLIYDRTDADMEMARLWIKLTEYEKMETIVYIKMTQREKNTELKQAA